MFSACENIKGCSIPLEICPRRDGDPATLVADNSKAKDVLNWIPKNDLTYSIKTAYEWEKVLSSN